MNITDLLRRYSVAILLIILAITFLPWLGMTPFNTKGEPREAIVAVSMLQQGDWILPKSFGCDIPYKPPFLAWCIAALSLLTGGVTEYTSRLPSALAAIAMAIATYRFFSIHTGSKRKGGMTALILISSIEVWRAASACRVDMVLTACMVGAIYSLYNYRHNGFKGMPWTAILLMSMGMLTKGPVAILLPCLCLGIYGLLRGDRFWNLFGRMTAAALMSLIAPIAWYIAAYHIGGENFWNLVYDENFGRFTGTMSYESHVKPMWYNFVTVITGMLPYTLLALLALGTCRFLSVRHYTWIKDGWTRLRRLHPATLYTVVCTTVIFVFYCIPRSKRSVYLLPIYPMLAYGITLLVLRIANGRQLARRILKTYCGIIASLAIIAPAILVYSRFSGSMPFIHGNMAITLTSTASTPLAWLLIATSIACGFQTLHLIMCRKPLYCFNAAIITTLTMLWTASGAVIPHIMEAKSDNKTAYRINEMIPADAPLYSFVNVDMLRYYTINFYLDDRVRIANPDMPAQGYIIVGQEDMEVLKELPWMQQATFTPILDSGHKSCDRAQIIRLYHYSKP